MSYIGTENFYLEVAKGNVPGHSLVHKFGRNDSVPNGSWAFVTLLGQTAWPLSAATTVRIKAGGNAADTAAGAGAREITVQGIVATTFDEEAETIAPAGASASTATSKSFWRVHRKWVSSAGTYGSANTGAIVLENGAGGTDIITMAAGEGQTQDALFTVPADKTGFLASVHVTTDSAKPVDVRCWVRENMDDTTAPVTSKRLKLFWDGIANSFNYRPYSPELSIMEKSDIWFEAQAGAGGGEVSIDFELLLVDN
jgi:hypothetical protein